MPALCAGRRGRSPAAAFTLLEILLVVALLAVLAAGSLPNFSRNFFRLQLKQAAYDLAYAMRYARVRAVSRGVDVALVFADAFHSYRLQDEDQGTSRRLDGRWGQDFVIPEEITVKASLESVRFKPEGMIEKARVELCRAEECYLVSTATLRGQVEVFSYKADE